MTVPTSYTESELAAYMQTTIAPLDGVLGWTTVPDNYQEPVNDALLAYGVADIAEATDMVKLRTLARLMVWRAVVAATAGTYDYRVDNEQFSRSQIHEHAAAMLAIAESEAGAYVDDGRYSIAVGTVGYETDPYQYVPCSEWGRS